MPCHPVNFSFIRNVLTKSLLLFILSNMLYALLQPVDQIANISAYNFFYPGRPRLPFGERPDLSYNLTISNIDAMFASHIINASAKTDQDYRIVLIGDSSVWGYLLKPQDTLSDRINQLQVTLPNGRLVRAFNLGYPTISLTKDLLILQQAMLFEPDLIIWLVTLEAFPRTRQLDSPILQQNPDRVIHLVRSLELQLDIPSTWDVNPTFWQRTIVGQRRELADIFRLQVFGVLWSATGIDQFYPEVYEPPADDLDDVIIYSEMQPPVLDLHLVAFDILEAGAKLAGDTPLLIVNEPIFRSSGKNSAIRYNFFYPRWAYDQYREQMVRLSTGSDWHYLDAWDLVAPADFTNSAIHLNTKGTKQLALFIVEAVKALGE
jgi:hypothetical protein